MDLLCKGIPNVAKKTASRQATSQKKTASSKAPAKSSLPVKSKAATSKAQPAKPTAKPTKATAKPGKPTGKAAKAAGKSSAAASSSSSVKAGKAVEWSYLRANCKTCEKAEAWLGKAGIGIGPRVDARKQTLNAAEGLKLAKTVNEVRVAKGAKVTTLNMKKGAPSDAELGSLIIGPTGNLRAPTLRHGKTLVVGFNEQLYSEFFRG